LAGRLDYHHARQRIEQASGIVASRDASGRRRDDIFGELQRLIDAELGAEAKFVVEGGGAKTVREMVDQQPHVVGEGVVVAEGKVVLGGRVSVVVLGGRVSVVGTIVVDAGGA
jgi:hypothetical protein